MCVGYVAFTNWDGPSQLIELAEEDSVDKDEKEKDSICSEFTQKLITEPTYSSHGITLTKAWETPYLKKQTPPPNRA